MIKLLPLIALLGATSSMAATITFQAGVNGYDHLGIDIRENGSASVLEILVGYQSGPTNNHEMRGLLSFSLASIPAGSTIDSITLTMTSNGNQSGNIAGVGTINLHEIIPNGVAANNFSEAASDWDTWGNSGTGVPWNNPGGDFGSVLTTGTLSGPGADATKLDPGETATFSTSASFVAAAQAALNAGLPLEMILIAPTAEANTAASNFFRFRSDDNADTGTRPLLTINYTIPEPTSALLALVAGIPFIARRRR